MRRLTELVQCSFMYSLASDFRGLSLNSQVITRIRVVCTKRKWIATQEHHSFLVQVFESSIWIRILMGTRKMRNFVYLRAFCYGPYLYDYVGKEGRKCVISLKA